MQIKFPVLLYKENDKRNYAFPTEKRLSVADQKLVRNGIFDQTYIIDSDGNQYLITGVIEKGWATPFWGYSLLIKGRQIKIDFDLEFLRQLSLNELKTIILERVNLSKHLYNSYGGGPGYIIKATKNAEKFEDLIGVFY